MTTMMMMSRGSNRGNGQDISSEDGPNLTETVAVKAETRPIRPKFIQSDLLVDEQQRNLSKFDPLVDKFYDQQKGAALGSSRDGH